MNNLSLIELYKHPSVNQLSGFARVAESLDALIWRKSIRTW